MSAIVQNLADSDIDAAEWQMRCDMAAAFRIQARHGWNEQIGNHNSLMLPGTEPRFLINPRGLLFQELTASSLIVCDLDGRVLQGHGEFAQGRFSHPRPHPFAKPSAACVMHVHPQYLTALSLLATPKLALAHHNNLLLNDSIVIDEDGVEPVSDNAEGDRIAALLGDKSILVMGGHGVTVCGPTVADAFDELFIAERTCMYHMTAMATGIKLRRLPERARRRWTGPWGEQLDARLHLDAWRRVLDREEPEYAS